jgi:hypothetical protein
MCTQRHGINFELWGDYKYYLEYLSRFFLSAATLAQRLLRDRRFYLFVFRAGWAPWTGRP